MPVDDVCDDDSVADGHGAAESDQSLVPASAPLQEETTDHCHIALQWLM